MPIMHTNDDGTEIEVFTSDELSTKLTEELTAKVGPLEAEIARLAAANGDISNNFKRYRDMTEEEKKTLSASETAIKIELDRLQDELKSRDEKASAEHATRVENLKTSVITKLAGGNDEMKKKIEENWELINIEVIDERTALDRGMRAFGASGGILDSNKNPLMAEFSGDAPKVVPGQAKAGNKEEFLGSDKGKAGLQAMGLPTE